MSRALKRRLAKLKSKHNFDFVEKTVLEASKTETTAVTLVVDGKELPNYVFVETRFTCACCDEPTVIIWAARNASRFWQTDDNDRGEIATFAAEMEESLMNSYVLDREQSHAL